jgi:hypothetical protein
MKTKKMPAEKMEAQKPVFVPLPEHLICLGEEILHQPAWANRLLKQLFESTFQNVTIKTKLYDYPGDDWEVGETARFKVTLKNDTGFDLRDIKVSVEIAHGFGVQFVPTPAGPDSYRDTHHLGDIPHGTWKKAVFRLNAVEAGRSDLRIYMEGQIGPLKETITYSGTYYVCDGEEWKEQVHPVYFKAVEVKD